MVSRNLTVMFTDIRGFTARTSAETRARLTELVAIHERLLIPVFRHFAGHVVKTIGDSFLVTFDSPTDAVLCGVAIQEVLRKYNLDRPIQECLEVRVAINAGEVDERDGDVYGEAVNIAARVEGIAEAGEVYFTEVVYLSMNKREAPSTEIGERTFHGVPSAIRIYKVAQDPNSELGRQLAENIQMTDRGPVIRVPRPQKYQPPRHHWPWLAVAAAVLLAAIGGILWRAGLIPGTESARVATIRKLIADHDERSAVNRIDAALHDEPTSPTLRTLGDQAVNGYVDRLVQAGQNRQAWRWLHDQTQTHPWMDRYGPRLASLDARAMVDQALATPPDRMYLPMYAFGRRHPHDGAPLFLAATLLQQKNEAYMAAWLYQGALDRGDHEDDAQVIQFMTTGVLERPTGYYPTLEIAEQVLQRYFPQRATDWALKAMRNGNAAAVSHAWPILKSQPLPRAEKRFYHALASAVNGTDLDRVLPQLALESDPAQRRHAAAVLQETVNRYPAFYTEEATRTRLANAAGLLKERR